jgi:dTDP-4-dehydrorhamnose reductase
LVNIIGTKNIVEACEKNNSAIVFITTNGVYDGENPPYDENSRSNPIDHYGYTKYEGEKIVQSAGVPFIIIRLMTMYGWNNPNERQNPMTWLIEMVGKNKISVNVVSDMFNNFLSVKEAAKSIWRAIELKKYGESFNIAGKNCISRFEFSKQIAKVFNLDVKMIHPVNLSFFKNFVTRPENTCFITKKMENVLGLRPLSTVSGLEYFKEHPITNNDWKKI